MANEDLKAIVKDKYGKAALKVTSGDGASCCGATARAADPITSNIYGGGETADVPAEAVAASLRCGNPTALADLHAGATVLDLGSGGRFAVSDVVVRGEVPAVIRKSVELWIGCVAGALEEQEYRGKLAKAGFAAIGVEPTRVYRVEDAREFLADAGIDAEAIAPHVDGKFMSAFIRARKPAVR